MAAPTLPVVHHPDFPQVFEAAIARLLTRVTRAIVHLNFDEPHEAQSVLLDALSDFNFNQSGKERA